jgi:hypothetical protein
MIGWETTRNHSLCSRVRRGRLSLRSKAIVRFIVGGCFSRTIRRHAKSIERYMRGLGSGIGSREGIRRRDFNEIVDTLVSWLQKSRYGGRLRDLEAVCKVLSIAISPLLDSHEECSHKLSKAGISMTGVPQKPRLSPRTTFLSRPLSPWFHHILYILFLAYSYSLCTTCNTPHVKEDSLVTKL